MCWIEVQTTYYEQSTLAEAKNWNSDKSLRYLYFVRIFTTKIEAFARGNLTNLTVKSYLAWKVVRYVSNFLRWNPIVKFEIIGEIIKRFRLKSNRCVRHKIVGGASACIHPHTHDSHGRDRDTVETWNLRRHFIITRTTLETTIFYQITIWKTLEDYQFFSTKIPIILKWTIS